MEIITAAGSNESLNKGQPVVKKSPFHAPAFVIPLVQWANEKLKEKEKKRKF